MKVRLGFVSNSSSSSFIIYGIHFEDKEEVYGRLRPEIKEKYKNADTVCPCSLFDGIDGVDYENGEEYDRYFGEAHHRMKEDETKQEFEERVRATLDKVFTDVKGEELGIHEEAYFNG